MNDNDNISFQSAGVAPKSNSNSNNRNKKRRNKKDSSSEAQFSSNVDSGEKTTDESGNMISSQSNNNNNEDTAIDAFGRKIKDDGPFGFTDAEISHVQHEEVEGGVVSYPMTRKMMKRLGLLSSSTSSSNDGNQKRESHKFAKMKKEQQRPCGSSWIYMEVNEWEEDQTEQFSAFKHIYGFPWRLRLYKMQPEEPDEYEVRPSWMELEVLCEKSEEAELWQCTAAFSVSEQSKPVTHTFASWNPTASLVLKDFEAFQGHDNIQMHPGAYTRYVTKRVGVKITVMDHGRRWRNRPILNLSEPCNGFLIFGEDKKEMHVNIESLSSQSPLIARLFRKESRRKDVNDVLKIVIGGVEFEEFCNVYKMIYGYRDADLTDENVLRVMEIAEKLDLKIVQDKAVSFLLSTASTLPFQAKLLLSERCNVPFLKRVLLSQSNNLSLKKMSEWEELEHLSIKTLQELFSIGHKLKSPVMKESSNKLSMIVQKWEKGQVEQLSPISTVDGLDWRLRLYEGKEFDGKRLELICQNPMNNEEWECTTTIECSGWTEKHSFSCGSEKKLLCAENARSRLSGDRYSEGSQLTVAITIHDVMRYPLPRTITCLDPSDGFLVFGEGKKKMIAVNKKSLASQSTYFDRLFFGPFKENNMNEIPIGDVEYQEFANIIKIIYGMNAVSLTDRNVYRMMYLADRFGLKIVEKRVVAFLIVKSSLSILEKLLISEQFNLPYLMDHIRPCKYSNHQLKKLCESPDWEKLSKGTIRVLFKKFDI